MSNQPPEMSQNNVRSIDDSRKQALHALLSSLSPADAKGPKNISEEQAAKLSEELGQILGDPGTQEKRNERGELLNEEGLPIIDITEPVDEQVQARQPPEPFTTEQDPIPLASLNEQERRALRARTDRLLDILEAEEEQEAAKADDLEIQRQRDDVAKRKEDAKAEKERKLAAREMQKRMGKALLKNLAEQRQKDEEQQKVTEQLKIVENPPQTGDSSKKARKRVSFANVEDLRDDESRPKPKPALAWGDVSVGSLKGDISRVRLKANDIARQPLKLDVVERVPGSSGLVALEVQDSDDESDTNDREEENSDEEVPSLDPGSYMQSDSESSGSTNSDKDNEEEEELDFSQAQLQREIALDYLKLRGTIGAEAHQAMLSHAFTGENEWDQPEVPLEATLSSKPPKPSISRFRASRHSAAVSADGSSGSVSLGQTVLPSGQSHALKKVVRTGKLSGGKLVGGDPGESASEDDNDENRQRMLALLKSGVPISFEDPADPAPDPADATRHTDVRTQNGDQPSKTLVSADEPPASSPSAPKKSKFLLDRTLQSSSSISYSGPSRPNAPSTSQNPVEGSTSTVVGGVMERNPRAASNNVLSAVGSVANGRAPQTTRPFKKPPTVVSVPGVKSSPQVLNSSPKVTPNPAVLSTMIVDSPSFPPPNASVSKNTHPNPILGQVKESVRTRGSELDQQRTANGKGGRVSRFKAERL